MQVVKVSDVVLRTGFFGNDYYITKDGRKVNSDAGKLALKYKLAQSRSGFVKEQIDDLLGYKYVNLNGAIKLVVPEDQRNENNPIWQKFEELKKLFHECTLLDRDKLSDASTICEELKELLEPEIDIEQGKYFIASKGKQLIEISS